MTDSILSRARGLQQQGNLDGALQLLTTGLQQAPASPDLLYFRAHLAIKMARLDLAAQDLERLLQNNPDNPQVLDDRGVLHQMQGHYMAAAECHLKAAEQAPQNDAILLNLAIALNHLGQKEQAAALYHDVLQINPKNTRAMVNLGIMADDVGRYEEAVNYLSRAVNLGDTSFEVCMALGNISRHLEQQDQAVIWYGRAVAQQPGNESAQFMLAAARGDTPDTPPPSHVAGLFDSYADTFETSLRDKLKYTGPERLFSLLEPVLQQIQQRFGPIKAIDLGAGTGLFGQLLRPHVAYCTAVDISPKMLEKAQATGVYDCMIVGDAVQALRDLPAASVQLITAADVLVYVGALEALFTQVRRVLVNGGAWSFTVEALNEKELPPYRLRSTGRYAHDKDYIDAALRAVGFMQIACHQDYLRMNKDQPLQGYYYVVT